VNLIKALELSKNVFGSDQLLFEAHLKGAFINKIKKTSLYEENKTYKCLIDLNNRLVRIVE